ncbi:MAG: hypothetical protein U0M12_06810 [Acutalibacteraceae bacterium]|nr:hypothetical protein [Acutalibacteraceae bacterium]
MKKYIKPSIEVIEYSLDDVISASIPGPGNGPADEGAVPDGGPAVGDGSPGFFG